MECRYRCMGAGGECTRAHRDYRRYRYGPVSVSYTHLVTIGNAEYAAMPGGNSIEKTYMYRYEQSGTSYDIRVKGQEIDDSDKELLEGIVLKLEDEGNKDAPWPWEGEPLEPVLAEQMVRCV